MGDGPAHLAGEDRLRWNSGESAFLRALSGGIYLLASFLKVVRWPEISDLSYTVSDTGSAFEYGRIDDDLEEDDFNEDLAEAISIKSARTSGELIVLAPNSRLSFETTICRR